MKVAYVDESGSPGRGPSRFFMCAAVFDADPDPMEAVRRCKRSALAERREDREIHAYDIAGGKGEFYGTTAAEKARILGLPYSMAGSPRFTAIGPR